MSGFVEPMRTMGILFLNKKDDYLKRGLTNNLSDLFFFSLLIVKPYSLGLKLGVYFLLGKH